MSQPIPGDRSFLSLAIGSRVNQRSQSFKAIEEVPRDIFLNQKIKKKVSQVRQKRERERL